MLNPVIFIKDPIKYDYSQFIISLLPKFINCNRIDLVILCQITESNQLNEILCFYYQLIRNHKNNGDTDGDTDSLPMFDYRFEINILFNLSTKKLNQLCLNNWNHGYIAEGDNDNSTNLSSLPLSITQISNIEIPTIQSRANSSSYNDEDDKITTSRQYQQFKTTAVGGTFDHLHDGHKILLSMAIFLTSNKLIIGITGSNLLINKKFKSQLQTFNQRQNLVIQFINLLLLSETSVIFFEIYEINDVCGPTGYINDIDNLIISQETKSGGEFVNKFRKDHGFKLLDITIIKVIGGNIEENSWKGKLSSTDIREQEYNRLLNQ
ncbi:pantetheine-phosphate adenylyltransferase [Candida albicans P57072]|uniref:Cytidylyltransferase family protein n=1 Tax=Candida albicans TaxID=5476 RepID=A0A8H6BXB7_CANAX|nr:Cytidylyltransferase family protein [Candida albicans]KGR11841.1 pantetheine-phosphate adenylyltransferase [Candida albicans P57072]KGR20815.1 pantetheine-phosphate adenylyltransferase [Candida albicans P37037]KHC38591.1 pantetheine-phosphate adenylyltransferase [Candida albicans P76055]KHC40035.1 pantetheine-phosphate adenylyltransferase [Candida albicans P76067]